MRLKDERWESMNDISRSDNQASLQFEVSSPFGISLNVDTAPRAHIYASLKDTHLVKRI